MIKRLIALAAALGWLTLAAQPAAAITPTEELVVKAQWTVEEMAENDDFGQYVRKFMKNAKGVLIVPNMIKGAFIFGGEGGSGVLLVKGENGAWSYPAFFTLGGISWGLQIGGSSSQIMMLLMTDSGVNALLEDKKLKFGADLGVALGPVGGGAEAAVTLGSADVLVWSLSKGAYLGISLEGSIVEPREGLNGEYYGEEVVTKSIVIEGKHRNPQADPLRSALATMPVE
ncbi:MAG: lipid-binding SYLF domain-containing protein [Proteobacteria bacterium]|nr:lipid-binding SYLF domain-containing protein [Pseudomonadota bacterium]